MKNCSTQDPPHCSYKNQGRERAGLEGKIVATTKMSEKSVTEDIEALAEAPDWLPDGWIMEVYRQEDGTINRYYTSPVSDCTFTTEKEVVDYLFSGEDEDILKSKEECVADNTLQKTHQWLPKGWVMEIGAGGEKMDKMYKFYVHSETGVRLVSKEDVLLYICDAVISECDTKGQCDTSSENNILAKVELNPSELPCGWVKEEVFRKTKKRVKGDLNYTDPTTGHTFRSLKAALSYLETKEIPESAIIQETSVHDLYSFDKYADLPERLRKGLKINAKHDKKPMTSSQPRETSNI
ncbi:unnamed protein product [Urochloa humidicola]